MNPQYQQAMIQALMGGSTLPSYMTGQNPTSGYGQSFMTGGMMKPNNPLTNNNPYGMGSTTPYASSGLTNNGTTQLQQPMSSMTM